MSEVAVNSDSIMNRWKLIQGYPTLLKGVLLSMKRRRVETYPDALVDCCAGALRNTKVNKN